VLLGNSANTLYIFAHVPKCGGSTLSHHLRIKFTESAFLTLTYSTLGQLKFTPPELFTRKNVAAYLNSLSPDVKANIKTIAGHLAYYGVHEFFSKSPRYITFLRHPVARTISHYNFIIERSKKGGFLTDSIRQSLFSNTGEIVPFEKWFETSVYADNYMTRFFNNAVDLPEDGLNSTHLEYAKSLLDKFYFVGLTETYDQDVPFLYYRLGINQFHADRNISQKTFTSQGNQDIQQLILKKNNYDSELYRYAQVLNRKMKKRIKYFHLAVGCVKFRKKIEMTFSNQLSGTKSKG